MDFRNSFRFLVNRALAEVLILFASTAISSPPFDFEFFVENNIYSENTAIMMSKDSTKLQFHKKEIFTRWVSSTFFVSEVRSISDSFFLSVIVQL